MIRDCMIIVMSVTVAPRSVLLCRLCVTKPHVCHYSCAAEADRPECNDHDLQTNVVLYAVWRDVMSGRYWKQWVASIFMP